MTKLLITAFCFFFACSFAQHTIAGKAVDSRTGEPLAFANILFNANRSLQCSTDLDGHFSFSTTEAVRTLTCSYVGYDRYSATVDDVNQVTIAMVPSTDALPEIVVGGENPANAIIRKVIRNKDLNNPENLTSFQCN